MDPGKITSSSRVSQNFNIHVIDYNMYKSLAEKVPISILNGLKISQAEDAKYLGLHLDRRLNWRKRIFSK